VLVIDWHSLIWHRDGSISYKHSPSFAHDGMNYGGIAWIYLHFDTTDGQQALIRNWPSLDVRLDGFYEGSDWFLWMIR
jgi:hypothetical protein